MDTVAAVFGNMLQDSNTMLMGLLVFLAAGTLAFSLMAAVRVRGSVKRRTSRILTDEERKRLAEQLKKQLEQSPGGAASPMTREEMEDLARRLATPDAQKELEERLRQMANPPPAGEAQRDGALGEAERGLGEAERGLVEGPVGALGDERLDGFTRAQKQRQPRTGLL